MQIHHLNRARAEEESENDEPPLRIQNTNIPPPQKKTKRLPSMEMVKIKNNHYKNKENILKEYFTKKKNQLSEKKLELEERKVVALEMFLEQNK